MAKNRIPKTSMSSKVYKLSGVLEQPKVVQASLCVNDLVLWCKEEYSGTAIYRRIPEVMYVLTTLVKDLRIAINKEKPS